MNKELNISVLGDGGWGTTLAILLAKKGYNVCLWGAFADYAKYLDKKRVNIKFLPGIDIPNTIKITHNLSEAVFGQNLIVFAIPSQHMRSVLEKVKKAPYPKKAIYLSVTKGIEVGSLKRMSEVIYELLGNVRLGVLSGPTIAQEVAQGMPSTAVVASRNKNLREFVQGVFTTLAFRVYTNDDVVGVELGGSLKNVIAIACGISDGLGFGSNTKAAVLSRGLSEISRLGLLMGAKSGTFSGISGLGDLVTTCISEHSRNRYVGQEIGKGKPLSQIRSGMQMVAEGVSSAKSAYELSLKYKIDMPIIKEVYQVLYRGKSASLAVKSLMAREKKGE